MTDCVEQCRRDRILDAAESAFAECGYEGASLRDMVAEAKVNLATVYYYFQSKDGLIEAVLKRRFGPIRDEQLRRLRELEVEREAGGRPPALERVLEALLLPPLRVALSEPAKHLAIQRLIGRLLAEPHPRIQEVMRAQHAEVRDVVLAALQRSCPALHPTDVRWRKEFVWGALAFVMCNPRRIEVETQGLCNPVDFQRVLAEMVAFFSAGFRAPGTGKANQAKAARTKSAAGPVKRRARRPAKPG